MINPSLELKRNIKIKMKQNITDLLFDAGCIAAAAAGSALKTVGIEGDVLTIAAASVWQNKYAVIEGVKHLYSNIKYK